MQTGRLAEWLSLERAWGRGQVLLRGVSASEAVERCVHLRGRQSALHLVQPPPWRGFSHADWSYHDVGRFVRRASAALELLGKVEAGSRVAVFTQNGVEQPLFSLAAMRVGAVAVPLNPQLRAAEVRYILEDCGAQVLVTDEALLEEVILPALQQGALGQALRCVLVLAQQVPRQRCGGVQLRPVAPMLERPCPAPPLARVAPEDTCGVFYTSGTTGFPKGAMLSSRGLVGSFGPLLAIPGGGPRSVLMTLPTAHIMGFATFLGALLGGARMVHLARFEAEAAARWLASGQVDAFVGVPSMYQLLERAGALQMDLRGVRVFVSAADVMPPALMARFKAAGRLVGLGPCGVPALFVEVYGSVELAGAALLRVSPPWWRPDAEAFVGWPLPGVRVQVRSEQGQVQPRGEVGQLWIKAPGVLKAYLGRREDSARAVQGGWLRTGDLARRGWLGQVRFVGRHKDVIKVGGYSVFPAEVEAALLRHEGVARAVVFGLPDPEKGAIPVAVLCPAPGAALEPEALRRWAQAQMARYKAPRRVYVLPEAQLPMGPTGKVLKRQLQERYRQAERG